MPKLSRALIVCLLLLCVIGLAATLSRSQADGPPYLFWIPLICNPAIPTTTPVAPAACATRFPLEADTYTTSPGYYRYLVKIVTNTQEIALIPYCSYYSVSWYATGVGGSIGPFYRVGEELFPLLGPSQVFSRTSELWDNSVGYFYYDCVGIRPECPLPPARDVPGPSPTPSPRP